MTDPTPLQLVTDVDYATLSEAVADPADVVITTATAQGEVEPQDPLEAYHDLIARVTNDIAWAYTDDTLDVDFTGAISKALGEAIWKLDQVRHAIGYTLHVRSKLPPERAEWPL